MKSLLVFLVLFPVVSFGQKERKLLLPQAYSVNGSFQKEDIFVSLGASFPLGKVLSLEMRYGVGTRRLSQQSLFSKVDLLVQSDFFRSNQIHLGPSFQLSGMNLSNPLFRSFQQYTLAHLGYFFGFGKKIKITQSSYFGYNAMKFASKTKWYGYLGFSLQMGLRYEI